MRASVETSGRLATCSQHYRTDLHDALALYGSPPMPFDNLPAEHSDEIDGALPRLEASLVDALDEVSLWPPDLLVLCGLGSVGSSVHAHPLETGVKQIATRERLDAAGKWERGVRDLGGEVGDLRGADAHAREAAREGGGSVSSTVSDMTPVHGRTMSLI